MQQVILLAMKYSDNEVLQSITINTDYSLNCKVQNADEDVK